MFLKSFSPSAIPDNRSPMNCDELRYVKTRLNLRHFVRYKNKIIDREMFYVWDLFKIPKTTYRDTLFNYRNLAVDIK